MVNANDAYAGIMPGFAGGNRTSSSKPFGGVLSFVENDERPSSFVFGHTIVPHVTVTPPPMSYNSVAPATPTVHPPSLSPGNDAVVSVSMERSSSSIVHIKCTFIPSLPDELSITTGETVRMLAEYDDGWAMCLNGQGEQGMVPVECLDLGTVDTPGVDRRNSKRTSSLQPARY